MGAILCGSPFIWLQLASEARQLQPCGPIAAPAQTCRVSGQARNMQWFFLSALNSSFTDHVHYDRFCISKARMCKNLLSFHILNSSKCQRMHPHCCHFRNLLFLPQQRACNFLALTKNSKEIFIFYFKKLKMKKVCLADNLPRKCRSRDFNVFSMVYSFR